MSVSADFFLHFGSYGSIHERRPVERRGGVCKPICVSEFVSESVTPPSKGVRIAIYFVFKTILHAIRSGRPWTRGGCLSNGRCWKRGGPSQVFGRTSLMDDTYPRLLDLSLKEMLICEFVWFAEHIRVNNLHCNICVKTHLAVTIWNTFLFSLD